MERDPSNIAAEHFQQMRRVNEFTVTEQHLALLRRAWVTWEYIEFGAPAIDGKRPYGNSDVLRDIAEALGDGPELLPFEQDDELFDTWLEDNEERLAKIHGEVGVVLQIVLATGLFQPGDYVKTEKYDATSWRPKYLDDRYAFPAVRDYGLDSGGAEEIR
jgi:hypothetical protein